MNTSAAKTSFFLAKRETGLETLLTGVLGRKTKFQSFDLAQLVLRAASSGEQLQHAINQALEAEEYGAGGEFGASKLRSLGLVPPVSEPTDEEQMRKETEALEAKDVSSNAVSTQSKPLILGGIQTVSLQELDNTNILLETTSFRPSELMNVETQEDKDRESLVRGNATTPIGSRTF